MNWRFVLTALALVSCPAHIALAQETTEQEEPAPVECDTDPLADPLAEDETECEEAPVLEARRWRQHETATLRGLDKITGRSTDLEMKVGETVVFGALVVDLQVCFQTPPDFPPESAAFLQVRTVRPAGLAAEIEHDDMIFSGWMFASSPGLNALEHPVYDVWVIRCARPELSDQPTE